MEDSPCLTGLALIIGLTVAYVFVGVVSLNTATAVENWASDKGYKILQKETKTTFISPSKYPKYNRHHMRIFLIKIEDRDGVIRKARVVACGKEVLEAQWED